MNSSTDWLNRWEAERDARFEERVESRRVANPLADFTAAELLAELARRLDSGGGRSHGG